MRNLQEDNLSPTKRRPQYKMLMTTSRGALHTDRRFLTRNNFGDMVISAADANIKVKVAMLKPMMVRN